MKKIHSAFIFLLFLILIIFISSCPLDGKLDILGKAPLIVGGTGISSLQEKFDWIQNNAEDGNVYIIEFYNSDYLSRILDFGEKNVTIRLRGNGYIACITRNDLIFDIRSGTTLIIDGNINLVFSFGAVAIEENYSYTSLVKVGFGGTLIMNNGARIHNNNNISSIAMGGGVLVDRGTFIMNGGTISSNQASEFGDGGGVAVINGGLFIMNGGTISSNVSGSKGGGVYIYNSIFSKKGGIIYGFNNEGQNNLGGKSFGAPADYSDICGHAVYAVFQIFTVGPVYPFIRFRNDMIDEKEKLFFDGASSPYEPIWTGNWESEPDDWIF